MSSRPHDWTMHDRVVNAIARMAFEASTARSALPTEHELTEQLQVSRSTVREAVKSLTGKGILEVRPRTGTRVQPRYLWNNLDPDVLRWAVEIEQVRTTVELNELRTAVEPMAASLAAQYAGGEEVAALWRHFVRMEDAVAAQDLEVFIEADAAFHRELFGAGGNALVRSLGHMIDGVLQDSFGSIADHIGDVSDSIALHRAVVVAVSARDADQAWHAMVAVIETTVARIGLSRDSVADHQPSGSAPPA